MVPFSLLNDFVFCPYSVYFHNIYKSYNNLLYNDLPQEIGQLNHRALDKKTYNKKAWIESLSLSSQKFQVYGKADLYNFKKGILFERKLKLINNKLFFGQRMQIVAQYVSLIELGYKVNQIKILSQLENKVFFLSLPTKKDFENLKMLVNKIFSFNLENKIKVSRNKCLNCIYKNWCYYYA